MKAIRKSDGKVIEVRGWRGASEVVYSDLDMNRFYQASELDFLPEKETAVLEGYVARDECGSLFCFDVLPIRESNYWAVPITAGAIVLPQEVLSSVTWLTEPKKVRIRIEEIEE